MLITYGTPVQEHMADCLFCSIASGAIPSARVYEDEHTLAFLDINPLVLGHTLVIPKAHAERITQLAPEDAGAHLASVPRIVAAVEKATGAGGSTVAWNNGQAAGQEVGHMHLHIIPRHDSDAFGPIHALFAGTPKEEADDLDALAASIREALG